jgi:hypothetical protein
MGQFDWNYGVESNSLHTGAGVNDNAADDDLNDCDKEDFLPSSLNEESKKVQILHFTPCPALHLNALRLY